MTFIWPTMLLSLLLIPVFVALYLRRQQQRQRLVTHYGSFGLLQAAGQQIGSRRHVPPLLFLTGLTLLMLAMARPEAEVSLPRIEGTVILAFDVSGSMAADDLDPNRMEAAKVAAQKFVEQQPESVLIGVVAFSDSGFAVQVPTDDREAILTTIQRLSPQLGTSLANGIFASLNVLLAEQERETEPRFYTNLTPEPTPSPTPMPEGVFTPAVIVLLTDGENNESPDPLEAAQVAADRGVRIHTDGIGSPEGAQLNIDGFIIQSRLDEEMLKQISAITGGSYYNAANEEDLEQIYRDLDPQLVIKPEKMEVTSIFAGVSIVALLVGSAFSMLWFSRVP
jgi:Ca-activated chloride channel family protein